MTRRRGERRVRRHLPDVHPGLRAKGNRFTFLTPDEISTGLAAIEERTKFVWLETPTNPALNIVDIAAASEAPTRAAHSSSSTTPSRRPISSGRSRSARTSCCTRRRSTSAAIPTSSADSSRRRTTRSRAARVPAEVARRRSGPVRRLARAARRQDARRAHGPPLRERRRGRRLPRGTPARRAGPLPGPPSHPGHASPHTRCPTSAGWSRSSSRTSRGRRPRRPHDDLKLAESLGGVESIIEHPARMTHASTADAPFAVPPTLIGSRWGSNRRTTSSPISRRARRMTSNRSTSTTGPGIVACYLLETEDGPALVDCGPATSIAHLKAGLAERGLDLTDVRHLLLSHIHLDHAGAAGYSSAKALAPVSRVGGRRTTRDRPDEARLERAPPVRRRLRRALGRARARSRRERSRRADRSSGRVLRDPRTCLTSRVVPRRDRDAYAGDAAGCGLAPLRSSSALPSARVRPRSLGADDRRDRAPCPARLALIHFGVFDDVEAHLSELRETLCAGGNGSRTAWTSRPSSPRPDTTSSRRIRSSSTSTPRGPYWHDFRGIERYWRKRREAS